MSRTYRENDQSETKARYQRRHNKRHMVEVLRFSMGRYIDANARANVDRSAKWFAAVDRAGRIVGSLDQLG